MKNLVIIVSLLFVGTLPSPDPAAVEGRTWIYYGGHTWARWGGVEVQLKQNGATVAETVSGYGGVYQFFGVEPGTYDLMASVAVVCRCYGGARIGVVVPPEGIGGQNILLYPGGPCCKYWFPLIMKNAAPIRP